jgi:hypothetical protein
MSNPALDKYAGIPCRVYTASVNLTEGTGYKLDTTPGKITVAATTDTLCDGIVMQTVVAGQQVLGTIGGGFDIPILSDGAGTISTGAGVSLSTATAGYFAQGGNAYVGKSTQTIAAAVGPFICRFGAFAGDVTTAASTFSGVYNAGASGPDQTASIAVAKGGSLNVKGGSAGLGALFKVLSSASDVLFSITDNAAQSITSKMADGAIAVGLAVDTVAAWVNATARLLSINNGGVLKSWFNTDGSLIFQTDGSSVTYNLAEGLLFGSTSLKFFTGGNGYPFAPLADLDPPLGTAALRWSQIWAKLFCGAVGSPLTDAATIAPTSLIHHVTGTGTNITTITAPTVTGGTFVGFVCLISDDALGNVYATGGNIAKGKTVATNQAAVFFFDGTSWYPVS